MRCLSMFSITWVVAWAPPASAQAIQLGPPGIAEPNAQISMSNLAYEPLGPGDLIYVTVANCPEVTRSFRIAADGDVLLPLLHGPVHAAGSRPDDLGRVIAKALVADHILIQPSVSVAVLEYRSRPVSVTGAVKHSVTFQATGPVTLLDALARADGLAADAGPELLISRPSEAGNTPDETTRIPLKELLSRADSSLNIALRGGETIRVPAAQKLYIAGNVKIPGEYPLAETGKSTVIKALALCQGMLPYAASRYLTAQSTRYGAPTQRHPLRPGQLAQAFDKPGS
jgi:polysaccharide export outer membrane protein